VRCFPSIIHPESLCCRHPKGTVNSSLTNLALGKLLSTAQSGCCQQHGSSVMAYPCLTVDNPRGLVIPRFPWYMKTESRWESATYIREENTPRMHAKPKKTLASYIIAMKNQYHCNMTYKFLTQWYHRNKKIEQPLSPMHRIMKIIGIKESKKILRKDDQENSGSS